ncbi:MAG: hypothetical protein A9Z00_13765 [Thermobacillus sp. ZCTH02-B1]|uniref:hypothetical protein n=1 Tax=Thermobacillus sp. ZCTH02-B1 TaxID=1858795 RepID=UPI000B58319F|nr:hypothetical protein [Thermobacillus sp. ZCTH02-B1]OUM96477.1 MAG: hypothetical protein A9Z00_13765 [Thermobacillus sp. ZCTH02-B1]
MPHAAPQPSESRIDRIRDPARPACRDDLVWLLHAVKKKVAGGDPALQELPRPQLIALFRDFAEAALMLLGGPGLCAADELERARRNLAEAVARLNA